MINILRRLNETRRQTKRFGWPAGFDIGRALTAQTTGELVRIRLADAPSPLWLRAGSTDTTLFGHIFVQEQYGYDWGISPRFILDCGAHIGLASIYFARRYPQASILSVEACMENFALLERNTASYPNIRRRFAAVWAEEGKVAIEDPSVSPWSRRCVARSDGTIPALTIAQLAAGVPIDILKMDIEGAEREIFSAVDRSWLRMVRVIMIELHDTEDEAPGSAESFYRALPAGFIQVVSGDTISVSLSR